MRLMRDNSGRAPLAIIVAIVLVLCLGAGGFAIVKLKKPGKGKKHAEHKELQQWKMEEFLVNLTDKDESRYLKVNIVLGVAGELPGGGGGHGEEGGGVAEIKARDTIISVLTKRSYRSLLSEEGKASLKEELKTGLNESLGDIKVEEVYFTSFAMQ